MTEQKRTDYGTQFVDLVEAMRQAERIYFEMIMDRDRHFSQHQERRALQALKTLWQNVDAWIEQYRKERAMLERWTAVQRTDEEQGGYQVTRELFE